MTTLDKSAVLPPIGVLAFWPMATAAAMLEQGLDLYVRNLEFVAEEIKLRWLRPALATPNHLRLELRTTSCASTARPAGFPR